MPNNQPRSIKSISELLEIRGLPKPEHPLIYVIDFESVRSAINLEPINMVYDFYLIALKKFTNVTVKYGQQEYDFVEGILSFMAPGQVLRLDFDKNTPLQPSGWLLLIHPDFFWNTPLAKTIKQYEYFDYSVNEALFLSDKEETTIAGIMRSIQQEYHANIDNFSHEIIITHIELLLNYSNRFYHRQFITRKIINHGILARFEEIIANYFKNDEFAKKGLPTVQHIAEALNVSPSYLRGLLKVLTGKSTQEHIHDKLIEKAKEKLSTTNLSVSEIAYELGFEHSQSFSKLFKSKTNLSPLEFRQSFN